MRSILIGIALFLSGCSSTTSNSNLLKGELFVHEKVNAKSRVVQRIELDEDNIYSIKINFR